MLSLAESHASVCCSCWQLSIIVTSFTACQVSSVPSNHILVDAQVHHQRYLLQPSALEIFLADRSNALLNLPSSEVCR